MRIYRNPFVSRESYFVKTGAATSGKAEASKSAGYVIERINGKWEVKKAEYYDSSLRDEMPVIAENRVPLESVIKDAILEYVLYMVENAEKRKDYNYGKGDE